MITLKKQTKAPEVVFLQALLGIGIDGDFGDNTERAVKEFQEKNELVVDGIVGPGTWNKLLEVHPREILEEKDYKEAADLLGCDIATVKAIKTVESGKSAFLGSGFPTLLFEAHIFFKELGSITAAKLQPSHPGIISRTWNQKLYKGGEKEVDRLKEAWTISPKAASASASYGAFQICGFNYRLAGYKSPFEFLGKQWLGEKEQLMAFVRLIKNSGIAPYLRAHNWTEVARRYNGPGYKSNKYDTKLAQAYEKEKKNISGK